MNEPYHIPALLNEAVEGLDVKLDGTYIDVTFGGGGHSRAIMQKLGKKGTLVGFDQDADALANKIDSPNFIFVHGNFRYIRNFLRFHDITKVDGILADLGVSFHHFDSPQRGFSFRNDTYLDMRMNTSADKDACSIVNNYSPEDLKYIFKIYGELTNAPKIAGAIVKARSVKPIETTGQLIEVISPFIDPKREKKDLAKAFQAIRIAVNNELGALEQLLKASVDLLNKGGRLAIISYHSLEDRMIKNFMKTGNIEGKVDTDIYGNNFSPFKLLTSKPILPSEEEIERNPRSRSAKLRIAERR